MTGVLAREALGRDAHGEGQAEETAGARRDRPHRFQREHGRPAPGPQTPGPRLQGNGFPPLQSLALQHVQTASVSLVEPGLEPGRRGQDLPRQDKRRRQVLTRWPVPRLPSQPRTGTRAAAGGGCPWGGPLRGPGLRAAPVTRDEGPPVFGPQKGRQPELRGT